MKCGQSTAILGVGLLLAFVAEFVLTVSVGSLFLQTAVGVSGCRDDDPGRLLYLLVQKTGRIAAPEAEVRNITLIAFGPSKADQAQAPSNTLKPPGVHQRHYTCQAEAGILEQGPIFCVRSFHAPDVDRHLQVDVKHAHRITMLRCDSALDGEEFLGSCHGCAAASQDRQRAIVVPIVDDPSQNVGVSARRQRVKKAPADNLAPILYPEVFEVLTRARHNVGQIEQYAPQGRVGLQIPSPATTYIA